MEASDNGERIVVVRERGGVEGERGSCGRGVVIEYQWVGMW